MIQGTGIAFERARVTSSLVLGRATRNGWNSTLWGQQKQPFLRFDLIIEGKNEKMVVEASRMAASWCDDDGVHVWWL